MTDDEILDLLRHRDEPELEQLRGRIGRAEQRIDELEEKLRTTRDSWREERNERDKFYMVSFFCLCLFMAVREFLF